MRRTRRYKLLARRDCRRGAFTLVEAVVSTASMAILMVGIGSSILMASKAIPSSTEAIARSSAVAAALSQITTDFECATAVVAYGKTYAEFGIPDQNGDTFPETVRYEWSGTKGAPLTRTLNGGTQKTLLPKVTEFAMNYQLKQTDVTTTQESESTEVLLASFYDWSGVSSTSNTRYVWSTNPDMEYVSFNPPADATKLRFTRALFALSRMSWMTSGTVWVCIKTRGGTSSAPVPGSTTIGSQSHVEAASLSTSTQWVEFPFTDAVVNNPASEYVLVMCNDYTFSTAVLFYRSASSAPADGTAMRYSTNSGSSWNTSGDLHKYDMPFYLYGKYTTSSTTTATRNIMSRVEIALQLNESSESRMETGAQLLNYPEAP